MNKPLIGLTPLVDQNMDNSLWMLSDYIDSIEASGGVPVVLPYCEDEEILDVFVKKCDGFLFTGGQDISPSFYNEAPSDKLGRTCSLRDNMEFKLFATAFAADMPIFGICRGLQLMNAALGGSLYQDIPTQLPSTLTHSQKKPYDAAVHEVKLSEKSKLCKLFGKESLEVNSLHHQGVKILAPVLKIEAVSPDGLVEAFTCPDKKFVNAVQWHPEYLYKNDVNSRLLFDAFVKAAASGER